MRNCIRVRSKCWYLLGLLIVALLSACGSKQNPQMAPSQPLISNSVHIQQKPTPTPPISIPRQIATPTPTPTPTPKPAPRIPTATPPSNTVGTGTGSAPYGPPPALTTEEVQLTQQLFALINHD